MTENKNIKNIEKEILTVNGIKVTYIKKGKYEAAAHIRKRENILLSELEKHTSQEYVKNKWALINVDGKYYNYPKGIKNNDEAAEYIKNRLQLQRDIVDKRFKVYKQKNNEENAEHK